MLYIQSRMISALPGKSLESLHTRVAIAILESPFGWGGSSAALSRRMRLFGPATSIAGMCCSSGIWMVYTTRTIYNKLQVRLFKITSGGTNLIHAFSCLSRQKFQSMSLIRIDPTTVSYSQEGLRRRYVHLWVGAPQSPRAVFSEYLAPAGHD